VTVGTFDGVHRGHRALIAATRSAARRAGLATVAVTWDRHPNVTLRPDRVPPLLATLERRLELLEDAGVEVAAVLAFDDELSRWAPERFARDVLARGLGARRICAGQGWRFGHRAAGDAELLSRLGRELGFSVETIPLAGGPGGQVSSSRVRRAVAEGDMEMAAALLGRPFELEGEVVRGEGRGRRLGYPTANLRIEEALARPPRGVYAGRVVLEGRLLPAAINVGVNPQFGGARDDPTRFEVYVVDFDGDLYGRVLRVGVTRRLRDEARFASVDDMLEQIARDVEAARTPTC
jgi:riboflavin kinase/FMN adenylyltransferase